MGSALALTSPAQAQAQTDPRQWQAYCDGLTHATDDEELGFEKERPIALPKDWRPFASASNNWLAVRTMAGATECISLTWVGEAKNFESFRDRFIGFEWNGYEAYGYTLIDRAGTGTVIETGQRPSFSPDGYTMVALEYSESGYGGLSGFGVWSVYDGGMVGQYLTRNLPGNTTDWRIDRWEGDSCVHISTVPFERIGDNWENLERVERDRYVAGSASGWAMQPGSTCPTYGE